MCAVEKVGEHLAERVCGHKPGLFAPPAPASVIAGPRNCLVSLRRALTSVISLPIQTVSAHGIMKAAVHDASGIRIRACLDRPRSLRRRIGLGEAPGFISGCFVSGYRFRDSAVFRNQTPL